MKALFLWEVILSIFTCIAPFIQAKAENIHTIHNNDCEHLADTIDAWGESKNFNLLMLILGGRFRTGENSLIYIPNPIMTFNYNTVEGFNATYAVRYNRLLNKNSMLIIGPDVRFAVPRNTISGVLNIGHRYQKQFHIRSVDVKSGRGMRQFNTDIAPFSNSIMTLLFRKNNLKLFEQDFISFSYKQNFEELLRIGFKIEHADRWELSNHPRIVGEQEHLFTPNIPENIGLPNTSFPRHNAFVASVSIQYQPWIRYLKANGKKHLVSGSSPTFRASYEQGIKGLLQSEVDFDNITIGLNHTINVGTKDNLSLDLEGGIFLTNKLLYFMDFFHFPRNQAPFLLIENDQSFMLLPYYYYSTSDRYFKSNFNYQMQDFLLTKWPLMKILKIKENLILNNLLTPDMAHYTEVGYGIDNILGAIRVEVVTSILNGRFDGFGARLGLIRKLDF